MVGVTALFYRSLFIFLSLGRYSVQQEDVRKEYSGSLCNRNCSTASTSYVCGTDGRTYTSKCALSRTNCERPIQVKHLGECAGLSRCAAERLNAQEMARKPTPGIFIPECNSDGSYVDAQCHPGSGYCWCVTKLGRPVSGSSARYKKPDCAIYQSSSNIPTRRFPRGRKPRKSCGFKEREAFNKKILYIFTSEYLRVVNPTNDASIPSSFSHIVNWKFTQFDVNHDRQLQKSELADLRKMVKKQIQPKPCARTFTKYCDTDQNGVVSGTEWIACLHIGIGSRHASSEKILSGSIKHNDSFVAISRELARASFSSRMNNGANSAQRTRPRPLVLRRPHHQTTHSGTGTGDSYPLLLRPEPSELQILDGSPTSFGLQASVPGSPKRNRGRNKKKPPPSCEGERSKALNQKKNEPTTSIYIPSCDKGNYAKVQCHSEFCWCVNPVNGQPIPETSTHNAQPDCNQTTVTVKVFQGCPAQRKEKFLTDIVAALKTEMEGTVRSNNTDGSSIQNQSPQVDSVKWKFENLDSSHDKVIDKPEWKPFKLHMASQPSLMSCGRAYFKYCDADDDHKISMAEFTACTTVPKDGVVMKRRPSGRRPGPNPLEAYLKAN